MPDPIPPLFSSDYESDKRTVAAVRSIRSWCKWHIAPVITQTLVLDGPGHGILTLPTLALQDVEEFVQDGVAVDVNTLEWSEDGFLRGNFTHRLRGIRVRIVHGNEDAPDLDQLVRDLAQRAQAGGVVSEAELGVSVTYLPPALMQHEKDQLAMYRLPKLSRR